MNSSFTFSQVTLLITHYNRSKSLERLLSTFETLNCKFGDIIVSDDASRPEHLDRVKELQDRFRFQLLTTPANRGHGHSINKGQDKVTTPYTLYVQEDFVPLGAFPEHFLNAVEIMTSDSSIDYIRFWALSAIYPNLRPYRHRFSEMIFNFCDGNHLKFYQYSDTPHLRRSNFLEKFGRYKEGLPGDVIDYKMAVSFLQNRGKGLFFDKYTMLFSHVNSPDEPSTMRPLITWKQKRNFVTIPLRWLYLKYKWIKCTIDVKFSRL